MSKLPICGVCVAFAWFLFVPDLYSRELNIEAYNIGAKPKPGPVTEFQPIKALPPIPFELPFDWGIDPFGDTRWQTVLHMLRNLVDGALAAGDFEYASKVFLDWQRWHKDGRKAPRSDAGTAERATRLAYLLRSTGWRDRSLVELAEQHAEKLQDPDIIQGDHNHGIGQLHGLAALCLDRKLRACSGAAALLERALPVLLRSQFAQSGVHRENSPGYHFYAFNNLSRMAPILAPYASDYEEVLGRAEDKTTWLVHPDLTTVALGDTDGVLRADVRFPVGNPSCSGIRSYREAPECYLLMRFEDVGYVIIRSDWAIPADDASMLFLQGGFFNDTHRHADDFSFEWFEHGRKILSDGGKYAYTRDEWASYFKSTRAHNTIEVDGLDFSVKQEDAYGDAVKVVEQTSQGMAVIMQVYHDQPDLQVGHRREIYYRPGEELGIKDTVGSSRPRVYVQWHHFAGAFELSGGDGRFQLDDGEIRVALETSTSCDLATKYRKITGQLEPRIQGWASLEKRERHKRWALGVECRAQNATFEARFEIQ